MDDLHIVVIRNYVGPDFNGVSVKAFENAGLAEEFVRTERAKNVPSQEIEDPEPIEVQRAPASPQPR